MLPPRDPAGEAYSQAVALAHERLRAKEQEILPRSLAAAQASDCAAVEHYSRVLAWARVDCSRDINAAWSIYREADEETRDG